MGCSVRKNRHGYLAFRLRFDDRESHEGTKLKDSPENRRRVEERARVIDQEIRDGTFEYLRWFPDGNLAASFRRQDVLVEAAKRITIQAFFRKWADPDGVASSPVTRKWRTNRVSAVRENVLPFLGRFCLDELVPMQLLELQKQLLAKPLSRSTIDGIIHSAFRSMLRAAKVAGYRVVDIDSLFDKDYVRRLTPGGDDPEIDPYTPEERDQLLSYFWRERRHYYPFVFFRFWTGTRPSEAIALRLGDVDLRKRVAHIRRSRVLGTDAKPKTKKSRREIVLHEDVVKVVRGIWPLVADHEAFLFTTPNGFAIDEVNFQTREWRRALSAARIRPRPFYNTRHTYISEMLDLGARPLWVAQQTGTRLDMIERHYGRPRDTAADLDALIGDASSHPKMASSNGNLVGTLSKTADLEEPELPPEATKAPDFPGLSRRAGDRDRTGDVQLGKLAFYR